MTTKPPFWLLAELTYRCPLHCVFCSNPVDYARHGEELDTATWKRILAEARALGAVQLLGRRLGPGSRELGDEAALPPQRLRC